LLTLFAFALLFAAIEFYLPASAKTLSEAEMSPGPKIPSIRVDLSNLTPIEHVLLEEMAASVSAASGRAEV
jgi:hypothetical protein